MQYNAIKCNTMQYNAIQCNTMQCNTMKQNEMQYNTKYGYTPLVQLPVGPIGPMSGQSQTLVQLPIGPIGQMGVTFLAIIETGDIKYFYLFSTLASAIALASVLEARMCVCMWVTHFEACLKPYSS